MYVLLRRFPLHPRVTHYLAFTVHAASLLALPLLDDSSGLVQLLHIAYSVPLDTESLCNLPKGVAAKNATD